MEKKMILSVILAVLALFTFGAAAGQEIPDSLFLPTIVKPAYALNKGPVVIVDEGHFNFHAHEGSDRPFLEFLRRDGYKVRRSRSRFSRDSLDTAQILVIPMPLSKRNQVRGDSTNWDLPNPSAFSAEEIMTVHDWVNDGGSLLLISDHMPVAGAVTDLALAFGIQFSNGHARDTLNQGPMIFRRSDGSLANHPITNGRTVAERVDSLRTFGGSAFKSDVDVDSLLIFRSSVISLEPTVFRKFTPKTSRIPVGGWYQGAVLRYGMGRAAFFGEAGM
ncbi:MAG: hypothetical protein KAQ62_06600, partial [Cyclobacteriaceae bacterium]|nr:hypothetical protein [Cyclobacteriaceae bacterium]